MHCWVNQQILNVGVQNNIWVGGGTWKTVRPPRHIVIKIPQKISRHKEIVKQGHLWSKVIVPNESPNMISY